MKRAVHLPTVAHIKKTDEHASFRLRMLAEYIARELVRRAVFDMTGILLIDRLRPDGKIGLEIPREPVA